MQSKVLNVGILVFDKIELLDFCGPYEVFTACNMACEKAFFNTFIFSSGSTIIKSINGMQVIPDFTIENMPQPDILVLPGGEGSKAVIADNRLMDGIKRLVENCSFVFSVCSGARILAKAGLLEGLEYTTHHSVFENLAQLSPSGIARPGKRYTDNGKILTAAGVSAGIDLSLYLIKTLFGESLAKETAHYMEYPFQA